MFGDQHHQWLRDFRRNLFGYARALCQDQPGAEDLFQDAMVRAMSAPSVPADFLRFRVWMFRLLRNLWIDGLRARRRQEELIDDGAGGEAEAASATGGEEIVVNRLAVRQAFMQLSKDHRDVLALVDIGGFSYEETAELLGIPMGTVMSRVSRARSALAHRLSGDRVVALPQRRESVR